MLKKTAPSINPFCAGFTLLELLICFAMLSLILVISLPYLFGSNEQRKLKKEQQTFIVSLKEAQQNSIIAKDGYQHGIDFVLQDASGNRATAFVEVPQGNKNILNSGVELVSSDFSPLRFDKLSGRSQTQRDFLLTSNRFATEITITASGFIKATPIEAKL